MVGRCMSLCVNLRFTPLYESPQLLGLRACYTLLEKVGHLMFKLKFTFPSVMSYLDLMEAIPLCDIIEVYIYIFIFIYLFIYVYTQQYSTIANNYNIYLVRGDMFRLLIQPSSGLKTAV